jgi:hypothetical protein
MEVAIFLTILITFSIVIFNGFIFFSGFLYGKKFGKIKGYDQAIKILLLAKNTEAWEMARMLEVDRVEKQKAEKTTKILLSIKKAPIVTTTIAKESQKFVDTSTSALVRKNESQ